MAEVPHIAVLQAHVFPRTVALMLPGALVWRSGLPARATAHAPAPGAAAAALALGAVLSALPGWMQARPAAVVAAALAPVALAVGYAALVVWIVAAKR